MIFLDDKTLWSFIALNIIKRALARLFGEKFNNSIILIRNTLILVKIKGKSYSRDNSVIFIKVLIEINYCDLDVELWIFIDVEGYKGKSVRLIFHTWFEFRSMRIRLVSILKINIHF